MTTQKHTLSKEERLSWKRYIDQLFQEGQSFIAFPLRVIFLPVEGEAPVRASMLVSVAKKKCKRAVQRNQIKRQVREAYRLRKHTLIESLEEKDKQVRIAFLYVGSEEYTFREMDKAMAKAIRILNERV